MINMNTTVIESQWKASIHYNPLRAEKLFDGIGLDVPKYPAKGDVFYKGEIVGYVSNFSGLVLFSKEVLDRLIPYAKSYDLGIWY